MAVDKEAKTMIFVSMDGPVSMIYKGDKHERDNQGILIKTQDVEWINFADGTFATNDPDKIKFIKDSDRYKQGKIVDQAHLEEKSKKTLEVQVVAREYAALSPEKQEKFKTMLEKLKKE
ncbi:MAG: hypothetical protein PHY56_00030 [Candidatus Omnitrophica bacterium]|nr:hypothetical protein [Candidatus Omnitrophota bacterium]